MKIEIAFLFLVALVATPTVLAQDHFTTAAACQAAVQSGGFAYYHPTLRSKDWRQPTATSERIWGHPTGGCFLIDLPDREGGRGWVPIEPGRSFVYDRLAGEARRLWPCFNKVYSWVPAPAAVAPTAPAAATAGVSVTIIAGCSECPALEARIRALEARPGGMTAAEREELAGLAAGLGGRVTALETKVASTDATLVKVTEALGKIGEVAADHEARIQALEATTKGKKAAAAGGKKKVIIGAAVGAGVTIGILCVTGFRGFCRGGGSPSGAITGGWR